MDISVIFALLGILAVLVTLIGGGFLYVLYSNAKARKKSLLETAGQGGQDSSKYAKEFRTRYDNKLDDPLKY